MYDGRKHLLNSHYRSVRRQVSPGPSPPCSRARGAEAGFEPKPLYEVDPTTTTTTVPLRASRALAHHQAGSKI